MGIGRRLRNAAGGAHPKTGNIEMTTLASASGTRPSLAGGLSWRQWLGWGLLALILAWSWDGAEMNPAMLWRDAATMRVFLADFFPPDFRYWQLYLIELLVTVQIAVWGPELAIVCPIPLGILCYATFAPWCISHPVPRAMDAFRSHN